MTKQIYSQILMKDNWQFSQISLLASFCFSEHHDYHLEGFNARHTIYCKFFMFANINYEA